MQLHYENGNRAGHDPIESGKLMERLCRKITDHAEDLLDVDTAFIDDAEINTLTVMTMQVPCCSGLAAMAQQALQSAKRKIPIKSIGISLQGDILSEEWVQ